MGPRLTLSTAKAQQVVVPFPLLPGGGDLDSRGLILYLPQPYSEDLDFFHWFPIWSLWRHWSGGGRRKQGWSLEDHPDCGSNQA